MVIRKRLISPGKLFGARYALYRILCAGTAYRRKSRGPLSSAQTICNVTVLFNLRIQSRFCRRHRCHGDGCGFDLILSSWLSVLT